MTLTLVLPLPPGLGNARMHWAAKHRAKKAYEEACDTLQLVGNVPPPPRKPLPRASIRAVFRVGQTNDQDNLMARVKFPVDWLKTRGYIVNDSPDCLTWVGVPEQIVKRLRDRAYTIELTLTEAA